MSYLDLGGSPSAPLLHFAHANGLNGNAYRRVLTPLLGSFRIVAWDARGHGRSRLSHQVDSLDSWKLYGADLAAFIDALNEPLFLVGHSLGATTSLLATSRWPGRILGVVLIEPPTSFGGGADAGGAASDATRRNGLRYADLARRRRVRFADRSMAFDAYRGRGSFASWPDAMLRDYLLDGMLPAKDGHGLRLACDPDWEAAGYVCEPVDLTDAFSMLAVPATLLHGTIDSLCDAHVLAQIRRAQPGMNIRCITDASHFLPMERPNEVAEACLQLLAAAG